MAPRTSLKPPQPAPLAGMIAPESDEFSFLEASLAALECKSSYDFDVSKFSSLQETAVTTPAQRAPPPAAKPPQPEGEETNQIPIPKTTLEALEQRLAKYKKGCQSAQEKGESPRERRMGRIVKQYEEAIRANKTRKPFNYSDLPTPPGFPPIPTPAHSKPVRRAPPKPTQSLPVRAAASPSTRPLFQPFKGKNANYNDCNFQFFIGFATVVKILPWLYSIITTIIQCYILFAPILVR